MINLNFKVNNQKLTKEDMETVADSSHNILQCVFNITGDDWEDKEIFAIFYNGKFEAYQLALEDSIVVVPYDVLKYKRFKVSLYAYADDTRITTNQVTVNLRASGYTVDIKDLEEVDEDIWTQIFEGIDEKADNEHTHVVEDVTNFPSLSTVALTGSYTDLNDIPSSFNPAEHTHVTANISDFPTLHTLATTGDYTDLENIPATFTPTDHTHTTNEITDLTNQLNNKVDKITGKTLTTNDFTNTYKNKIDDYWQSTSKNITNTDVTNWNNKQDSNLVTNFNNPTDTNYPSAKLVKDYVDGLIGNITEYINR